MGLSQRWYRHIKDDGYREDFKRQIINCVNIWERMSQIIEEEVEASLKEMRGNNSFESPAWAEKQAYQLGLQDGLLKIKQLLPLTKGDK